MGDVYEAVDVPATGGGFEVLDEGAVFPRAEVARVDGRGVSLALYNRQWPMGAAVVFTRDEAARLVEALVEKADLQ